MPDTNKPYEESELIDLLKQKELHAYHYFYDKYAAALYGFIMQIVKNRETGNVVLHEVFTTIWFKINTYDPQKERLFSWMLKICRHAAIQQTKPDNQKTLRHSPLTIEGNENPVGPSSMDNYKIKKSTQELNEENSMLIDLCFYQGFSQHQIAEVLNIPLASVKLKIRNALLELRKNLSGK